MASISTNFQKCPQVVGKRIKQLQKSDFSVKNGRKRLFQKLGIRGRDTRKFMYMDGKTFQIVAKLQTAKYFYLKLNFLKLCVINPIFSRQLRSTKVQSTVAYRRHPLDDNFRLKTAFRVSFSLIIQVHKMKKVVKISGFFPALFTFNDPYNGYLHYLFIFEFLFVESSSNPQTYLFPNAPE